LGTRSGTTFDQRNWKSDEGSRFIAILITENYNKTVWTKTEYKKALSREQKEGRTVMLPLIVGNAKIPSFIKDKLYIDLRQDFFSGITRLVALVHGLTPFRVSNSLVCQQAEERARCLAAAAIDQF